LFLVSKIFKSWYMGRSIAQGAETIKKKWFAIWSSKYTINRELSWTKLTFCNFYISREKRPCKIPTINQYSYLSHKSSYSTLLHNSEAKFFQHHQFLEKGKKCFKHIFQLFHCQITGSTPLQSRASVLMTRMEQLFTKYFLAYFHFSVVAVAAGYLMWNRHKNVRSLKNMQ
jgi:hypothetical protein